MHRYAVRKVIFSPHAENILASCSYDMSVKLWDAAAPEDALIRHDPQNCNFSHNCPQCSSQRRLSYSSVGFACASHISPVTHDEHYGMC